MTTDSPSGSQPASPTSSGVTVVVCHSCRGPDGSDEFPRPGSRLADNTRRAADGGDVRVRSVGCLGNCKRGMSAAILRDGAWSYVFGWLGEQSGEDLIAGATLLAGSQDGFMPFRARPESLKRGLIARIPTLDHIGDDI